MVLVIFQTSKVSPVSKLLLSIAKSEGKKESTVKIFKVITRCWNFLAVPKQIVKWLTTRMPKVLPNEWNSHVFKTMWQKLKRKRRLLCWYSRLQGSSYRQTTQVNLERLCFPLKSKTTWWPSRIASRIHSRLRSRPAKWGLGSLKLAKCPSPPTNAPLSARQPECCKRISMMTSNRLFAMGIMISLASRVAAKMTKLSFQCYRILEMISYHKSRVFRCLDWALKISIESSFWLPHRVNLLRSWLPPLIFSNNTKRQWLKKNPQLQLRAIPNWALFPTFARALSLADEAKTQTQSISDII